MKREEFGQRLKLAAERNYGGLQGLAKLWNMKVQGVYKYINGERLPGSELLKKLTNVININWLLTGEGTINTQMTPEKNRAKTIPVITSVQCGVPATYYYENSKKYIEMDGVNSLLNPFAVVAEGLSMAQTIMPGDILICSQSVNPIKDNSVVLVSYKTDPGTGMGLVKRVKFKKDGRMILYSDNSRNFPPFDVRKDEIYTLFPVYPKFIRNLR
jgi:phage repressor protein C with HTH and peptisase S24 domain